ncbi:hypothetical protein AVEN_20180-1 [Araneus ventricosus]|uniref:G-protein coupled receptors family 1 profile domain-containing protein n=1 Tax=Araneus ventricosus TaxID=182803 RepID=A0A4Y2CJY3_ARAVE|nr:hypothetical protein AVEN_20180-1 [Araneus ventricosus]
MVKIDVYGELNVNCTDKEKCFMNITDFYLANMNLSDDAIYFEKPGEMLTPWKINQYFFFIVTTYVITFIFGVMGNVMVIAVILGDRTSRNVTSLFLVSLAIADLLLLVICAPLDVAHYFVVQWDSAGTVCKMAAYAETVSAFASVFNLLAVTLERFVVIVYPIRSRSLCTMSNCKKLVIGVWTASLILALPVIFTKSTIKFTFTNYEETVTIFSCKDSSDWRGFAVAIYRFITLFALPSVIMITCYAWVIIELWISTKTMDELTNYNDKPASVSRDISRSDSRDTISQDPRIQDNIDRSISQGQVKSARQQTISMQMVTKLQASPSRGSNPRSKSWQAVALTSRQPGTSYSMVIKMLILVVILFLVCWGPRLMMEIVLKCCLQVFNHGVYTTRFVFYLLPFVHSCLNPMVYCFMSSKFRSRLFQCCCNRRPPKPTPIQLKSSTCRNTPSRIGSTYTFSSCTSPSAELVSPAGVKIIQCEPASDHSGIN